jgi:Xaa-Pro dipeptidase
MQQGDVIIHGCGVQLNGYWGGVERTMFLGRPSDAVRRYLDVALEAQRAAIAAVKPGALCSDVDAAARRVIDAAGMGDYVLHRTGHGIGLNVHEFPSVAKSVHAELKPGMVVSIEPGLYVPGLGGFRHEDNVVVTETGARVVSTIPSDFESMILDPGRS